MERLSEEERRALRGSKFAPLPPPPPCSRSAPNSQPQPRLAHPGGPMKTNKAAALAKFLERKLQDPEGLASIDPDILQLAVNNAKRTVLVSSSGHENSLVVLEPIIPERHVAHHMACLAKWKSPCKLQELDKCRISTLFLDSGEMAYFFV